MSRPLTEYQAWAAARLRHAASKQLLVHMKLEEAASKAEEASEHVGRCVTGWGQKRAHIEQLASRQCALVAHHVDSGICTVCQAALTQLFQPSRWR